ncbi:MAG: hypothetical protein ACD_76C00054G0002 [uncultured bacterium]|nr:MAG: hypothetical protein ACD_76C00054G0002 [uncultured bacterium]HBD05638.1 hypothetical protein [Candidatus Uhrbacteria bacterium]
MKSGFFAKIAAIIILLQTASSGFLMIPHIGGYAMNHSSEMETSVESCTLMSCESGQKNSKQQSCVEHCLSQITKEKNDSVLERDQIFKKSFAKRSSPGQWPRTKHFLHFKIHSRQKISSVDTVITTQKRE